MISFSTVVFTAVALLSTKLIAAQDPDNKVTINSAESYCVIMPRDPHTNIGDSEHPGGMQTYALPVLVHPTSKASSLIISSDK